MLCHDFNKTSSIRPGGCAIETIRRLGARAVRRMSRSGAPSGPEAGGGRAIGPRRPARPPPRRSLLPGAGRYPERVTATLSTTELESEVRSYSRSWPTVFDRASGTVITDADGVEYLDFFAGAGALNYGHNNPALKEVAIDHLVNDRLIHSLDMFTTTRNDFLETFAKLILEPRGLHYKVMFPGPAGTTAVEAALKLARKVTKRTSIVHFTDSFHGMTLGGLAVTGNAKKRAGAGIPLANSSVLPFDGYAGIAGSAALRVFEHQLNDPSSGLDKPAAVIVETVQGEGGINAASSEWLHELQAICKRHDILFIVDDVQMGCGRTGGFFSFEEFGLSPDIVVLSKSISGFGFPMALTLFRKELDVWKPAEHNGTFRGIGPAFATAAETLRLYWSDDALEKSTIAKGEIIAARFARIIAEHEAHGLISKGRGLARGLEFETGKLAGDVTRACFEGGLLLETSGPDDEVVKLLPPLTVTEEELERGLDIIERAVRAVLAGQ